MFFSWLHVRVEPDSPFASVHFEETLARLIRFGEGVRNENKLALECLGHGGRRGSLRP